MHHHVSNNLTIVDLVHWVDNANHPDVLPTRAASGNKSHPFGKRSNHQRRFHCTYFPTVGCYMNWWRIISFRSWSRRVTPRIRQRQLIWKTSSLNKSVARSVQHSEAYSKVVLTKALKIFIIVIKQMLRNFQTHSLSRAKTPDALKI